MARAAFVATISTFRAGDGGKGEIASGIASLPMGGGMGSDDWLSDCGKPRSSEAVPYASMLTLPACASALRYLPRLKPANGIGRSEIQWLTCSPEFETIAAGGVELGAAVVSILLPVATRVHPGG